MEVETKSKHFSSKKNNKTKSKFIKGKENVKEKKKSKSELSLEEITLLSKRIQNELPPTGKFSTLTELKSDMDESKLELWEKPFAKFKDLPISSKTLQGLNSSKYFNLTPIQRCTLPHSLGGRDILGASKTGSGKTLCFLIPILENLYRDGFIREEGLGALILLPTRELAIQVFEVINKIGKHHNYSVGLVIGGNDYEKERYIVNNMNILIGTPGRILQHMGESYMFSADNLKILVIDEADRILDEGFEDELVKIINYLPKNRQTLLFSATLTRNLKRLVKIHMRSPEYINISNTDNVLNTIENINKNELSIMKIKNNNTDNNIKNSENNNLNDVIIPKNLNQFYTIVEPEDRVNILYSFLKLHKMSKILVFVSSRKQVRYFTEVFKHLKLGMLFLDIHGKQKQGKRYSTFHTFSEKRNSVVLFATDLASRGVDFPAIDWVIQLDPPEDISQYIHRVGRTARYKSDGNSVLFVSEKEINFVKELELRKIKVTKIKIPPNKINNITPVVRSLLSENKELIEMAEKAITSYVKSINLMANKNVFNVKNIDLGKLALSYGLVSSPEMVVKSKEEVEEKLEEENNKIIDMKNKKIEEEKNLVKENLINNNTENKKKSKLAKLKEKIKLKKLMKQKEKEQENKINKEENETQKTNEEKITNKAQINLEEENEEDEFLSVKKNKKEKKEKSEKKEADIKLGEKRKKSEEKEDDDEEENEFYKKVKKRLDENKEKDKQKEKERISIKHKEDKLKLKEKDYQKHGIEIEEEDDYNNNYEDNNSNEDEESEENNNNDISNDNKEKKDKDEEKPKIKININHSTLKEKENAALEILKKKGIL